MKRTDAAGHVGNLFTDGDEGTGQVATVVDASVMNHHQEEIARAIEAAGITLDESSYDQLTEAVKALGGNSFKNRVLNGDFNIWQRDTSHSLPKTSGVFYTADRWITYSGGGSGSATIARLDFSPGQTAVPDNPTRYLDWDQTTIATTIKPFLEQRVEGLRFYSNVGLAYSFWAKVSSGTLAVTPKLTQDFGSGGSSNVTVTEASISLTTSWQKFVVKINSPSLSGKTIGTNAFMGVRLEMPLATSFHMQIAHAQLELGDVATAWEHRPVGVEEFLCKRFYENNFSGGVSNPDHNHALKYFQQSTGAPGHVLRTATYQVEKRSVPTVTFYNPTTGNSGKVGFVADQSQVYGDLTPVIYDAGSVHRTPLIRFLVSGFREYAYQFEADSEL